MFVRCNLVERFVVCVSKRAMLSPLSYIHGVYLCTIIVST